MRAIYLNGKLHNTSSSGEGKGRDKGGDESLCMMMDIGRYFIIDS